MIRGADLFAKALERAGVTQLFSVSGNHLMALYDTLLFTNNFVSALRERLSLAFRRPLF